MTFLKTYTIFSVTVWIALTATATASYAAAPGVTGLNGSPVLAYSASVCDDEATAGEVHRSCCLLLGGKPIPDNPDGTASGFSCDLPVLIENTSLWGECIDRLCKAFDRILLSTAKNSSMSSY